MTKLLICGSREFNDYQTFVRSMNEYLSSADITKIEIVSGGARGADAMAEQYATDRGIKFMKFPADWEQYGRAAGYVRNAEMAKYCAGPRNACIGFWDGKSLGTKHMLNTALKERMSIMKVIIKKN